MRFPKSTIFIVTLIAIIQTLSVFGQRSLFTFTDSTQSCSFNSKKLDQLIEEGSLYQATTLLNEAINFSKKYDLLSTQAKAYNALGIVYTKMSNYKNAESYHQMALKIFDSLNDKAGKNVVYSDLIDTYLLGGKHEKFDSIYSTGQLIAKELNSELYFINLDNEIKKNYYSFENKNLLKTTTEAIKALENSDFHNLNFSKQRDKAFLKNKLLLSYKYHKAIAQIKLAGYKDAGFKQLFSIDEEELKKSLKNDFDAYRRLASFNYYKFRYYNEFKRNMDSANKYLLKSDTYKYNALSEYENRKSRNGELIYKIINTEQELNLTKEIRQKDAKASQILLATTIITSVLLIITLIILYFYFKAKRNIQSINRELKTSNDKLLAIDKDRLEFFSILSHELRTPIYGITGLATLVNQEKSVSKRQEYLDSLISSSNYLSILIDNILQANKLRFEEKSLRLKPDKISKIINHVVSTVKVAAKNKGLELRTYLDKSEDNELILIDKVAFSQILINLAYNAIRYTKEGHIEINVIEKSRTEKNVTLRFEINDTGIGIKEEHRPVVFSAFENKAFLHKNSSGSGLGLHIVKTLLKSHGADIDFISTPNEGSSFFFEVTFEMVVSNNIKRPISIAPATRPMHILIVDDNKVNLLITKKNVEKINGYSSEIMSKGREAISMVKSKAFDLVLMDINMPDMDGYEVTKHIRMFNKTIPILALTALNSSEILVKAEEVGINQIITKPYIFEDFKAIIMSYAKSQNHYDQIDLEAI